MRAARNALVTTCAIFATGLCFVLVVVLRDSLPGATAGYLLMLAYGLGFCTATAAVVFGIVALVRFTDTRKLSNYLIVGLSVGLWGYLTLSCVAMVMVVLGGPE